MLRRCNLTNHYGKIDNEGMCEKIVALIAEEFKNADQTVVLVETSRYARLLPLPSVNFVDVLPSCQRVIVSSATTELRLEFSKNNVSYRILREEKGERCVFREDILLFRITDAIDDALKTSSGMRNREYFQEDADGMYVFFAERLAGCAQ